MLGKDGNFWIGLNDIHTEGSFIWTNNGPKRHTNWNGGEPSNSYYKDCVEMVPYGSAGKWNVAYCSKIQGYICEAGKGTTKPIELCGSQLLHDPTSYRVLK